MTRPDSDTTPKLILPANIGQTSTLQRAAMIFKVMEAERDISCFDGQPGTGKTTAATFCARNSSLDWRYFVLPLQANPRAITATVYTAVFQREAKGTERQMSTILKRRMADGDIGLIADEAHHCGVTGAQQLRYLWDDSCWRGKPFPLLLVGADVRAQLSKAEEVRSRIARWVHFDAVTSMADLRVVAAALHPRLAATSDDVLERLNDRIARRSLRNWHQIGKHIKYLPDTDPHAKNPKALTVTDIQYLRDLTGIDEVAPA